MDSGFQEPVHSVIGEALEVEKKDKVTEDDIDALHNKYYWDHLKDSIETDDYARFGILGLQIIFVPLSIGISVFLYLKGKKQSKVAPQDEGRANYEEMRAMFTAKQKGKK